MNMRTGRIRIIISLALLLLAAVLLGGCSSRARVGEMRSESQAVELGDAAAVSVEIDLGAGELELAGGAEKLLEADFNYNVAALKPEVAYRGGALTVRQPEDSGLPVLRDSSGFRNEWHLRLNSAVPIDLKVAVGAGTSRLNLAGLQLTGLDISLGAGQSTIDLSGALAQDLDATIDAGAGEITLRLPQNIGARVDADTGVGTVSAVGLNREGDVYTNDAYGRSDVTLRVTLSAGVGKINLEVAEAAGDATDYSALVGELEKQVQAIVDEAGITGLSLALVDDQQVVWADGFGFADKENGIEASADTVYMVASISKLFTASAVMQLADQGKIDIDQPVQSYVPEFSIKSRFPEAAPITPRALLSHHAGMPSDWVNGMVAYGDDQDALTRSEFGALLEDIQQAYVTNPPFTSFSYSNQGYSLLGHVVEQAAGQDFIEYMDEAVLGPLGMDSSSFTVTPEMKARLSKEYKKGAAQEYYWSRDISAATLRSTVNDLSRFMMMVFGGGELDGERILQAGTLVEMLTPQNSAVPLDFDGRWGLGWWLIPLVENAGTNAWHQGGEGQWNSFLLTLPEHKLGVVLLSNSEEAGGVILQVAATILEHTLQVKTGIAPAPAEPPEVVALPAEELARFDGLYSTDLGWMTIHSDESNVYADAMGQTFRLLPHGEGHFSIEGVSQRDARMSFKEVNGRTALSIVGFTFGLVYGERIEPASISQAWMDRLGSYEVVNPKPGTFTFITNVELKIEGDFLMLTVIRADTGEQVAFPIGTLSDSEAYILGLGLRGRGEAISVVEADGEEQLFYSGYRMRKTAAQAGQPPADGSVYQDPQGRFTIPLAGGLAQVKSGGSYGVLEVPGLDIKLSVLSVDASDLASGEAAALAQVGIDPATLNKYKDSVFGDWSINFYTQGDGRGVAPVCQVVGQVTYCLIATGEKALTLNPPESMLIAIKRFTIAGSESSLPRTVEDFEAYVNSFVGDIPPGMTVVINQGGKTLYSKAFGVADGLAGQAAEVDTVFMWGSMTKIVTGVAVMQLIEQGKVKLDAPVSDYLDYVPPEYGITVRQLLDHSDGLGERPGLLTSSMRLAGDSLPDQSQAARDYMDWLQEPMFEPGSKAAYANPGFVLLGEIVAAVTGQAYTDYVQEHILQPLGLENTGFTYSSEAKAAAPAHPASKLENLISYVNEGGGLVSGEELVSEVVGRHAWMKRYYVLASSGGLLGPATEAIRFAQMHLNGGELDGVRILSAESVAAMQEMQLSNTGDALGYGLAWRVRPDVEHPFVEHDGGGRGLWAKIRLYPASGLAIVLMSNASDWNRDRVADAAASVVFALTGQ